MGEEHREGGGRQQEEVLEVRYLEPTVEVGTLAYLCPKIPGPGYKMKSL